VIPLLGGSVTSASRYLGHYLAFGTNLVVFGFSIVFVYRQSERRARQPTHWLKYGPTYLTILATLLVMADNTRHVLQDVKVWPSGPWPGSSQYRPNCETRAWKVPSSPCNASKDCGSFDCGDGTYSAGAEAICYECYIGDGLCSAGASESFACLSTVGWIFTVGLTYSGFLVFFFASFWNANLIGKLIVIRNKWHALRRGERASVRKEVTDEDAADAA
jgi:hypothetical protein